jgi:hypothetical protein
LPLLRPGLFEFDRSLLLRSPVLRWGVWVGARRRRFLVELLELLLPRDLFVRVRFLLERLRFLDRVRRLLAELLPRLRVRDGLFALVGVRVVGVRRRRFLLSSSSSSSLDVRRRVLLLDVDESRRTLSNGPASARCSMADNTAGSAIKSDNKKMPILEVRAAMGFSM